jgi:mono/diheme cytochrome c family protein
MSLRRPVALAAALLAVAVGVGACSTAETPAAPSDPVLAEGQQIYLANCASCHGRSGGGGLGPKLSGVVAARYPNIDDQKAVILNGQGSMPAFKTRFTAEQLDAVTRYTREGL